jgi:hypothetical protein
VWRRGWLPTFAGLNSQSSFLGGPLEKREKRGKTRPGRGMGKRGGEKEKGRGKRENMW